MGKIIYEGNRKVSLRTHKRTRGKIYGQVVIESKDLADYEDVFVVIKAETKRDAR